MMISVHIQSLPLMCLDPRAIAASTMAIRSSAVACLSLVFIAPPKAYAAGGAPAGISGVGRQ